MDQRFHSALAQIDSAHGADPRKVTVNGQELPYELHYSNKMAQYLNKRDAEASPTLMLAVCAQHLRRWEVRRDSYPMTKAGYHAWRGYLKKRQADLAYQLCTASGLTPAESERVAQLIRKEDLKADPETQVLEDVRHPALMTIRRLLTRSYHR